MMRTITLCLLSLAVIRPLPASAGPSDALARVWSDYNTAVKELQDLSTTVDGHLSASKKLREMDKQELDKLIAEICGLDIGRSDDEGERKAKSLSEKVQRAVKEGFAATESKAGDLVGKISRLVRTLDEIVRNADPFRNDPETKSDATKLYEEAKATKENAGRLSDKVDSDMRTLVNIKEGAMNGANNPKIRAAIEYGKEKHRYNQRICQAPFEHEYPANGGFVDCISFQKDACAVWEFKPDTNFTDSSAAAYVRRHYLDAVTARMSDDSRAIANCKKDSGGKPIFEAKGAVYPACKPGNWN
jgi:hypothetical protein